MYECRYASIERFSYPHLNFSFIFFSLATDVRTELVLPFAVQSVFNATDPPPCLLHNGGTNECIVGEFNRKNVTIPDVFSQGQFLNCFNFSPIPGWIFVRSIILS